MITSSLLSKYKNFGLVHAFSTTKEGPLFNKKENWDEVISNRERFCELLGISIKNLVFFEQVHGSKILIVTQKEVAAGAFYKETELEKSDGGITKEKNVFLAVKIADCVPILGFDPVEKAVFAVHAGVKGLIQGIHSKLLAKLFLLGSKPENLLIYAGPSIKKESYFFESSILQQSFDLYDWKDFCIERNGRVHVDLQGFLEKELLEMGVKKENIDISPVDTFKSERFYSYKRGDVFKRFVGVIGLV